MASTPNARDLFWVLTRTEFRLRDQGTWFGFLWSLMYPALIFGILYLLFSEPVSDSIQAYAPYLLIGIVQWNFFSSATSAGLTALSRKAPLLLSFPISTNFIVVASVLAAFLTHLLEWAVLLLILPWMGASPALSWLLLPAILMLEFSLVLGIALAAAPLSIEFRDLGRIWGLMLYALFFCTPIFYDVAVVGEQARAIVSLNPLSILLAATREALLDGKLPSRWLAAAIAPLIFGATGLFLGPRLGRRIRESL